MHLSPAGHAGESHRHLIVCRALLVTAFCVSAGVHLALTPEHLSESLVLGGAFAVGAAGSAILAVILAVGEEGRAWVGTATLALLAMVAAYPLVHLGGAQSLGIPAEPADVLGYLTVAVELVGVACGVVLFRSSGDAAAPVCQRQLSLVPVVLITIYATLFALALNHPMTHGMGM